MMFGPLFLVLGMTSFAMAQDRIASSTSTSTASVQRAVGSPQAFQVGQNLSITTETLRQGHCSIGLQLVGCGLTDRLTFGTSPWMWDDYQMANIGFRQAFDVAADERWAVQAIYFKTTAPERAQAAPDIIPLDSFEQPASQTPVSGTYEMEAYWLIVARTKIMSPSYRLHLNGHLNYYVDETMPFSLRRPSLTKSPWQVNLTMLHELKLVDTWSLWGELGVLDLLRDPMRVHTGASLAKSWGSLSGHIGFTLTSTPEALFSPLSRVDYQQILRFSSWKGYDRELDPERVRMDYALHPEFSLQYTF